MPLSVEETKGVAGLGNGWHDLAMNDASGALDYQRTAAFHKKGCAVIPFLPSPLFELLRRAFNALVNPPWSAGVSVDALEVFEALLRFRGVPTDPSLQH